MPTPSEHAILSPSSAHRWMACTPSARLEQQFENQSSEASRQGTAAHALGEHKIRKALKQRSTRPVSEYDDDEMEELTDSYRDFVMETYLTEQAEHPETQIFLEVPLDLSEYIPDGHGTSDAVIVSDHCLRVIDLKYGKGVQVDVRNNPQLMIYALGAYEAYGFLFDFDRVSMTIFQPRCNNIDTWKISLDELLEWAGNTLVPAAKTAFAGEGEYCCGEWCRFCRAANHCRKRMEAQMELARSDFARPPLISDEEIEDLLPKLDDLIKWAGDLQDYALACAVKNGKRWKGYKLVHGKSNRKYRDEALVAAAAKEAGYTDIYRKSLITLTEMEKLMGKKTFSEVLGPLVIKPEGKLTLVPESDKREAVTANSAKEDFQKEGE